jgi:S-(hydroxymethyl)glutathione dehydrogenase / alcohol dehydrogenase
MSLTTNQEQGMQAAVLHGVGDEALEVRDDVELVGEVGPTDVKVKMHAAGVCHSDLSAMTGILPVMPPSVLGHEGSGEIVEVGELVTDLAVGDRVIVTWTPPCGKCRYCRFDQPNLCTTMLMQSMGTPRFRYDGTDAFAFLGVATFSETSIMAQEAVTKVPNDVPYDILSLMGCGVMTGVGAAINTAKVTPGSSVAVIGCGGVGISAIQGARIAGAAEIVAIDALEGKLEASKRFGATNVATPDTLQEVSQQVTGGEGFDYVFECVGKGVTIRSAFDATRRGGTTVVVGAGSNEEKVEFSAFELFFSEKRLLGSYYGGADVRRDYERLLALWRSGRLDLESMITSRLKLDQVNDGFAALSEPGTIRQVIEF